MSVVIAKPIGGAAEVTQKGDKPVKKDGKKEK